jgi:peptide/nickel transport system permease protein
MRSSIQGSAVVVRDAVLGTAAVDAPAAAARTRRRIRRSLWFIPLLPVGAGALAFAVEAPTLSDGIRWSVVVIGLVALYLGIDSTGAAIWGPAFDTGFWLSAGWVALIAFAAVVADWLPLAEARNASAALLEPVRARPDLLSEHPFGTDTQGLDMLGGVVYGARVSLQVSLGAVAIGMAIGAIIGVSAGFFRGPVDTAVSFLTDSLLAFPPLILLLAVVSAVTPNPRNIAIALAVLTVPTFIRLARANTLTFAQQEFVLAARSMGASNRRIIFRELVPNVVRPLLSYGFIIIAVLIVAEASLSFLGVGIQRPTPTWGNMIAAGQDTFEANPHLVFVPGSVMFLTVFAINRIGERARRRWDTRARVF